METILGLLSVIYQQMKALSFLVVVLIQKLSKENKISSKLPRRILIIVVISLQFFFKIWSIVYNLLQFLILSEILPL